MKRYSKLIAAVIGILPVLLVTFGMDDPAAQRISVMVSAVATPFLTFFAPANA